MTDTLDKYHEIARSAVDMLLLEARATARENLHQLDALKAENAELRDSNAALLRRNSDLVGLTLPEVDDEALPSAVEEQGPWVICRRGVIDGKGDVFFQGFDSTWDRDPDGVVAFKVRLNAHAHYGDTVITLAEARKFYEAAT